ncbi:MAG: hypothetical protein ACK5LC_14290 [Coprobacillaceae bacterium]
MSKESIVEYLKEHESNYIGKYRCHSNVLIGNHEHKFRYYIRDAQFREISVFVTIHHEPVIKYEFSVDLHEQEQEYIVKDALQTILYFMKYKTVLDIRFFEEYIQSKKVDITLEPLDFRNLLDYLEYHHGTNQGTVDTFYSFFMPYIDQLYKQNQGKKIIDAFNLLLDKILYEYEWDGETSKYLDTQYQFHLYYFRQVIVKLYKKLDLFYKESKNEILEEIHRLCELPRFTFAIISDFRPLILSTPRASKGILEYISEKTNDNLVVQYFEAIYHNDKQAYIEANMDIIRFVMQDMLTFANHDLQLAIGNAIVAKEGYDLLIQLFSRDYNTFVFVCFPIDSFPEKYRKIIRAELEQAILFYAARMEHDEYRLSSFEQVSNINRLLMENYKEYGRNGK